MKKIIIFILLIIVSFVTYNQVFAYETFEWYEKVGNGKLIGEFTDKDYKDYYNKVKRRMFDWNYYEVNRNTRIKFISKTVYDYYNNGKSVINFKHKLETEETDTVNLKATGSVKIQSLKGTKIFGDGLNVSLQSTYDMTNKKIEKEIYDVDTKIEPGNQMVVYMYGEGFVSNGVAKKYVFFIEVSKGGYEVFTIASHYQKMEVTPI